MLSTDEKSGNVNTEDNTWVTKCKKCP
jgi:hypothetical protein